jgi:membrane associated rhomboid family serine protease
MLLLPVDRNIDWRHPPIVTFCLVLANVLVFVFWQGGDEQRLDQALRYYFESGLAAQELPVYLAKHAQSADASSMAFEARPRSSDELELAFTALTDPGFQADLAAGGVVSRDDPQYADWRRHRDRLEAMLAEVVTLQYAFHTSAPTPITAFSHAFLHGGWGHLLGNMFFLIAVGALVERTLGRIVYLAAYLLGGLCAVGFYFLVTEQGTMLVGASGAIAGLMGLYTVRYWTRPVRFFYFVFVYFDYVRLPALALLPLWIGNELVQLWLDPDSQVAYTAHLGGLLGGMLIGLGLRWFPDRGADELDQAAIQAQVQQDLEEAAAWCRRLEYDKARTRLEALHRLQPDNIEVLALLRQTLRTAPASDAYHRVTHELLLHPGSDLRARTLVHEAFDDYLTHAKPKPRIDYRLACQLAARFAREGKLDSAELLARGLVKHPQTCSELALVLDTLTADARQHQHAKRLARLRRWRSQLQDAG